MSDIKMVIFDYDGVIVDRNYTLKCFGKFSNSKIFRKITDLIVKSYVQEKLPTFLEPIVYLSLLYCLKGVKVDGIEKYVEKTTQAYLVPGVESVVKKLKEKGIKVGIISENIQFQPRYAAKLLGVDFVCSNEIEVKDGKITGKISKFSRKNRMIEEIKKHFSLTNKEIRYVGDDADLSGKVKCILFNPKRKKEEKKVDDENCFLIKDLYQLLSQI